jgi:hypothetical protein
MFFEVVAAEAEALQTAEPLQPQKGGRGRMGRPRDDRLGRNL